MSDDKPLRGVRILFVDDCPDQQRVYVHLLAREGANVHLECNGQAAVDAVRRSPNEYDMVLIDMMMPELDGLEATKQLRELGCTATIVAMTAFPTEDLSKKWFAAGCDAFLEKPFPVSMIADVYKGSKASC